MSVNLEIPFRFDALGIIFFLTNRSQNERFEVLLNNFCPFLLFIGKE